MLKLYWPYWDELSVEDGLVMKSDRVVVPKVLQKGVLETVHTCVFWCNINKDIEALIS